MDERHIEEFEQDRECTIFYPWVHRVFELYLHGDRARDICASNNLPTEQVDRLVLSALADRVFTAPRVRDILSSVRKLQG